jgi:hypothetical protein
LEQLSLVLNKENFARKEKMSKRPLPAGNGKPNAGGGGGYNAGPKKSRGGDSDGGSDFEEELMMMDEMNVDQMIDLGEGEGTEQQEARWARPPLPFGEDHTAVPLGKNFNKIAWSKKSPYSLMLRMLRFKILNFIYFFQLFSGWT